MSAIVGERDKLLQAAAVRNLTPRQGKDLLLTVDPQAFHVAADGTATPGFVTLTAHKIDLVGEDNWVASNGATLAGSGLTRTLAYSAMPGATTTVTLTTVENGQIYTAKASIGKTFDGAAGAPGGQTAVARLYRWSTFVPSAPAGTSTFTWATGVNSAYTGSDGWAVTAPANPGSPGARLYIAEKPIAAPAGTTASSPSYVGASISAWSGADGAAGSAGVSGIQAMTVTVFQWAATIPAGPTGSATLTWPSSFGAAPTGYTLTPGTGSPGYTLWAATVQVIDTATAATTAFNWSSASVMAIGSAGMNGAKGDTGNTGGTGAEGASYVTAYVATTIGTGTSAPAATTGRTSLPAANSGGLTGTYTATVQALTAGQYLMQTDGIYNPATNQITWSIPYQASLKVGTLSAITANLGAINAGSIDLGSGSTSWHVDTLGNMWAGASTFAAAPFRISNAGAMVARNLLLQDSLGNTVVGPTGLQAGFEAPGTKNSDIVIGGRNLYSRTTTFSDPTTSGSIFAERLVDGFTLVGVTGNTGFQRMAMPLAVGPYTLSFNLRLRDGPGILWVDLADTTTQVINQTSTADTHYEFHFNVTNAGLAWLDFDKMGAQGYYFTQFKLEAGTKATSYTPSPEDVAGDTALAQSTATNAKNIADGAATSVQSKLSKSGSDILSGQISLQSPYAFLVGNINDGLFMGSTGLVGRKAGTTTFIISNDGSATFGGTLQAPNGSLGSLTLAAGGNVRSSNSTGWGYWPAAGGGAVSYFGAEGIQVGNFNDNRYIHIYANGNVYMPGFAMVNSQLTLTNTILIAPSINSGFTGAITPGDGQYYTYSRNVVNGGVSPFTASGSGGSGNYSYLWSCEQPPGAPTMAIANITSATVSTSVTGHGYIGEIDFYLICAISDTTSGTTRTVRRLFTVNFT